MPKNSVKELGIPPGLSGVHIDWGALVTLRTSFAHHLIDQPSSSDSEVWRVRPAGRVAAVCVVVAWTALAGGVTVGGGVSTGVLAILWCALVVVAVGAWRWAFVPYVALTPAAIVIQNRFSRSTIEYNELARAQPGYYGILIQKRDGTRTRAWAVQKSNAAQAARRHTRADDLVEAIMLRAHPTGTT